MNVIINVLLNIIILRILCPLIVLAGAIAGLFFLFDSLELTAIADMLKPMAEVIISFFKETLNLLKGLM